jgi:hypothetical protein
VGEVMHNIPFADNLYKKIILKMMPYIKIL